MGIKLWTKLTWQLRQKQWLCRFIQRHNDVNLYLSRSHFVTKFLPKTFIKLTRIYRPNGMGPGLGMGLVTWPDQWVLIYDAEMFTLVPERDRDQEPLPPIAPVPFLIPSPVPVPCSVEKPLDGKIVASIKGHNNAMTRMNKCNNCCFNNRNRDRLFTVTNATEITQVKKSMFVQW